MCEMRVTGTVCGEPKKSCLECPNEQSLWPICAIEFRINQISVKTFETVCKMNLYNCVNNRRQYYTPNAKANVFTVISFVTLSFG